MIHTIQVAAICPADRTWAAGPVRIQLAIMEILNRTNAFLQREAGGRYEWKMHPPLKSTHNTLTLCTEGNGVVRRDQHGRPVGDEGAVWWKCFPELGLDPRTRPHRWIAFMCGGDKPDDPDAFAGWAGGRNNMPNEDTGTALVGNHFLKPDNLYYVSHEITHALGISSHTHRTIRDESGADVEIANILPDGNVVPYYLEPMRPGAALSVGQKMQLLDRNFRFLRDA